VELQIISGMLFYGVSAQKHWIEWERQLFSARNFGLCISQAFRHEINQSFQMNSWHFNTLVKDFLVL
jgi:hypothetical protein